MPLMLGKNISRTLKILDIRYKTPCSRGRLRHHSPCALTASIQLETKRAWSGDIDLAALGRARPGLDVQPLVERRIEQPRDRRREAHRGDQTVQLPRNHKLQSSPSRAAKSYQPPRSKEHGPIGALSLAERFQSTCAQR